MGSRSSRLYIPAQMGMTPLCHLLIEMIAHCTHCYLPCILPECDASIQYVVLTHSEHLAFLNVLVGFKSYESYSCLCIFVQNLSNSDS